MNHLPTRAHAALASRLAEITSSEQSDRGESSVTTAVMVVMLVAVAIAVATAIGLAATAWTNQIPTAP